MITDMRIIYPVDDNGIAVVTPCDCGLTIEQIAAKDVPAGVPYRIISVSDLPADRMFRAAWEADFGAPDGYGLGHEAWFAQQAQQGQQDAQQQEAQHG